MEKIEQTNKVEPEKVQENIITLQGNMTPEERAIFNRVSSEDHEWATIDPYATIDFDAMTQVPFKLPEPAQKLQDAKKFKFRWFERTPKRVDEVKNWSVPLRWWPVNGVQPEAGKFDRCVDGTTGAVHMDDQMLFFKPWWMWEREQEYQDRLAGNEPLTAKDDTEKNDIRFAASRRKEGEKASRVEVSGNDIVFRGEADVDAENGRGSFGYASEGDMVVNE